MFIFNELETKMKITMMKLACLTLVLHLALTLSAQLTKTFYPSGKLESVGAMVNGKKSGEWKWYFESGRLSIWGKYTNGEENGEWKWYHTNGVVWAVGYFLDGESIGSWKRFEKKGKLLNEALISSVNESYRKSSMYRFLYNTNMSIGSHLNGLREGEWKEFTNDGHVTVHCWYKNGKKHGKSKGYVGNSSLLAVGIYHDGKREGQWRWFNETGTEVQSMWYKNGYAQGPWKAPNPDVNSESTGIYENGVKQGAWVEYNTGEYYLFKGSYKNGKLDGECIWYHSPTQIGAKGIYSDGILINTWEKFYPSGAIEEIGTVLKKGEVDWKIFFEGGTLKAKGRTVNGFKDGFWKEFHENGQIQSEGIYKNGTAYGVWKYYHENGNLWRTGNLIADQEEGQWLYYLETGALDSTAIHMPDLSCDPSVIIKGKLSEGLMAYAKENRIGFMDSSGRIVLSHVDGFDYVGRLPFFKEGRCMFFERANSPNNRFNSSYDEPNTNFGFIDRSFNPVIPAIYPYSEIACIGFTATFSKGYSVVPIPFGDKYTYNYVVIDTAGNQLHGPIEFSYGCLAACLYYPVITEGVLITGGKSRSSGLTTYYDFMDVKSGRSFTVEDCTLAGPFSEGIAAVEINYEYITFIDRAGKIVTDKKFYTIKRGSNDLSDYQPGNGCDRLGAFVNGKILIHHFENEGYGPEVLSVVDKRGNVLYRTIVDGDAGDIYEGSEIKKYMYEFECDL